MDDPLEVGPPLGRQQFPIDFVLRDLLSLIDVPARLGQDKADPVLPVESTQSLSKAGSDVPSCGRIMLNAQASLAVPATVSCLLSALPGFPVAHCSLQPLPTGTSQDLAVVRLPHFYR